MTPHSIWILLALTAAALSVPLPSLLATEESDGEVAEVGLLGQGNLKEIEIEIAKNVCLFFKQYWSCFLL